MRPNIDKKKNLSWRTPTARVYLVICIFDFIIFPILWSIAQIYKGGEITMAWSPITLVNGGILHLSFGAILGVSANAKMREKIAELEHEPDHEEATSKRSDRKWDIGK